MQGSLSVAGLSGPRLLCVGLLCLGLLCLGLLCLGLLCLGMLCLGGGALAGRTAQAAELRGGAGARIAQAAAVSGDEALSLESMQVSGAGAAGATELTAAGSLTIAGAPNTAVSLTLALEPTGTAGGILTDLTHDAGPAPATGPDGRLVVRLGAALRLSALPGGDTYAGTYSVVVHY